MDGRPQSTKGMLLIVTIAMIFSILAAGAIIMAAGALETRSTMTLQATEENVGSTVVVFRIVGEDASADANLERLELFVNLGPASHYMNWSSTKITVDRDEAYQTALYAGPGVKKSDNTTDYTVTYLHRDRIGGLPDFIYKGDRVIVRLNMDPPLIQGEKVFIQIMPEYGNICRLSFKAPHTMLDRRVEVYP